MRWTIRVIRLHPAILLVLGLVLDTKTGGGEWAYRLEGACFGLAAAGVLIQNPAGLLGFLPGNLRKLLAVSTYAMTAVLTIPGVPDKVKAIIAGLVMLAVIAGIRQTKGWRESEGFIRCAEVSNALAAVSAVEASRAVQVWEDRGKGAAREFFLLAQQADVDEKTLSSVGKGAFVLGFVFGEKGIKKATEKNRRLEEAMENQRLELLARTDELRVVKNQIDTAAESRKSREAELTELIKRLREKTDENAALRERLTERETAIQTLQTALEEVRTDHAETIPAKEEKPSTGNTEENRGDETAEREEVPAPNWTIARRDEWIVRRYAAGGVSMSQLAAAVGLSKSSIQSILNKGKLKSAPGETAENPEGACA